MTESGSLESDTPLCPVNADDLKRVWDLIRAGRGVNTVEDAQLEGSVTTSDEALELVRALFPRQ